MTKAKRLNVCNPVISQGYTCQFSDFTDYKLCLLQAGNIVQTCLFLSEYFRIMVQTKIQRLPAMIHNDAHLRWLGLLQVHERVHPLR